MSRKLFLIGGLAAIFSIIYTVLLTFNKEAVESFDYLIITQTNYFHVVMILFLAVIKREYQDQYMVKVSWYFLLNIIGVTIVGLLACVKTWTIDYKFFRIFIAVWFGIFLINWFVLMKSVLRLKVVFES
jgi:hypothetical protein